MLLDKRGPFAWARQSSVRHEQWFTAKKVFIFRKWFILRDKGELMLKNWLSDGFQETGYI